MRKAEIKKDGELGRRERKAMCQENVSQTELPKPLERDIDI